MAGRAWRGTLEAVVLHNRFAATHNVLYAISSGSRLRSNSSYKRATDHNVDQTNTWGAQLEYQMPLADAGWAIGWLATSIARRTPSSNYDITNVAVIPWDPAAPMPTISRDCPSAGSSDVWRRCDFTSRFAATPGPTAIVRPPPSGRTRSPSAQDGRKPVQILQRCVSASAWSRHRARRLAEGGRPEFGLMVRSINYRLQQIDHVELTQRSLRTGWLEVVATWA